MEKLLIDEFAIMLMGAKASSNGTLTVDDVTRAYTVAGEIIEMRNTILKPMYEQKALKREENRKALEQRLINYRGKRTGVNIFDGITKLIKKMYGGKTV